MFWILFSLVLLIVIPDRWHVRREIAKRQAEQRTRFGARYVMNSLKKGVDLVVLAMGVSSLLVGVLAVILILVAPLLKLL